MLAGGIEPINNPALYHMTTAPDPVHVVDYQVLFNFHNLYG